MPLQVLCSRCNKFIKSFTKNDFGNITGEEICPTCAESIQGMDNMIESFKATYKAKVAGLEEELIQTRDRLLKRVLEPERKESKPKTSRKS